MKLPPLVPTLIACFAASLAAAPAVVLAQDDHARHEQHAQHGMAGGAVAQLQLQGTAKWQTDASLRKGMAGIRKAFDADHAAIHAGKQNDVAYERLAERIDQEVESIVANCRLPADADANLHFVIADLMQGASLMRGVDPARSRHDGAALVHGALNAYGRFFEDPSWKPDTGMPRH